MDLHYSGYWLAIYALVVFGFPGVAATGCALAKLDAVGFAFRHPRTALTAFAIWFCVCGLGINHVARGTADTAVAQIAAADLATKLRAENREWSLESGLVDFPARCVHDFAARGATPEWCRNRVLPYVEDRYDEATYRQAVQQWEVDTGFDAAQLPPPIAAMIMERARAEGHALLI